LGKKVAMVGAGAVGGYVGGHLARNGHDVTLIDLWHANIEAIRANGVQLSGMTPDEECTIPVKALHIHEVSGMSRHQPIDIAIISLKSYDTAWATTLIEPHLAPGGYVLSLQNCINEEAIAGIVGWGKVLGCIASRISVELYEPGRIRRQAPRSATGHTVFRVGEVHGRATERVKELGEMLSAVDTTKVTTNLWGERWSKLCHNAMRNGIAAATGLPGKELEQYENIRKLIVRIGSEAVQIGQALGYDLEKIGKLPPDRLAAAGEDPAAAREIEELLIAENAGGARGALQRPSMGQDMVKGRPTEIDFINGFIVRKGQEVGMGAPANALITDIVKRVEKGEVAPSPENIPAIH
jgi:2-dehydropantoate 2-reductase